MGAGLAVAAALCYGICHFINGVLSRRTPGIAVGTLAQVGGTAIVAAAAPFFPASHVSLGSLGWGALSGVGSASLPFLYRGMGKGQISVVSPVSELSASALPVIFGLAIGERLHALAAAGVLISFPAIWLAARPSQPDAGPGGAKPRARVASGVLDGLLGGAGVAVNWVALSRVAPAAGLWPLVLSRVVSLAVMIIIAAAMGVPLQAPRRVFSRAAIAGAFGTAGTGLYMFATRLDLISIVSVITALYPAIPVILATAVLKERLRPWQMTGLGLAAAALILLSI